ncbi:MAG: translation initiation factor IF-3 [Clostridia bacterium]|nr:translation initiation factor IF-3 [Clostridia bacterium]
MIKQDNQLNEEITDKEVRLIGPDGAQLGIVSSQEALRQAREQDLDLVKISPNAVPPVCRIMNYGKFKFDQMKREKEARKNQKVVELKEIQLSMTIELHDMEVKAKNANKFLLQGNKVKVALRMRGRQQAYFMKGIEICKQFYGLVEENAVMDKEPKVEGRNVLMILSPKTQK